MRLASLFLAASVLAAVLIFSPTAFAQHSSGGGSSGGGSSGGSSGGSGGGGPHSGSSGGSGGGGSHSGSSGGSGGGGSHSGSSGGSGSSASSHSSGGSSVSHGSSVSPGSSRHSSSSASWHFTATQSRSNASRSVRQPNAGVRARFLSFLRHPFRRPEPKTEANSDLRRPICFKGPCLICPSGHASGKCAGLVVDHRRNVCSTREIWNGGACLLQTQFLDECTAERVAMENQAQRAQAAEAARQSACEKGASQECSNLSSAAQSESSLYRSWQNRYNRCRQRSGIRSFSGLGIRSYPSGIFFDRLKMDLDYR